MSGFWTEDEDQTIRQGAASGLSYGEVAEMLGKTRNQIAGRARRLGVRFGSSAETHARRTTEGLRRRWASADLAYRFWIGQQISAGMRARRSPSATGQEGG